MLLRIALVIAILAGIGAAVLNFLPVKDKVTGVMQARDTFQSERDSARTELAKTKKDLDTTKGDLDRTKTALAASKKAQEEAENERATAQKESQRLDGALKEMTAKWKASDQELSAWAALSTTPDQIRALVATNKELSAAISRLDRDKLLLQSTIAAKNVELNKIRDPDYTVALPPDLVGRVVQVDPKFDFVVLNIGQREGVLQDGRMLVSRDGKLVAKVRIAQVEPDRSIANVLPGWRLADVVEGDVAVTPAVSQ